ncbi:hypothetical protein KCU92_g74, partial [Aureobasidium melanogenum]
MEPKLIFSEVLKIIVLLSQSFQPVQPLKPSFPGPISLEANSSMVGAVWGHQPDFSTQVLNILPTVRTSPMERPWLLFSITDGDRGLAASSRADRDCAVNPSYPLARSLAALSTTQASGRRKACAIRSMHDAKRRKLQTRDDVHNELRCDHTQKITIPQIPIVCSFDQKEKVHAPLNEPQ